MNVKIKPLRSFSTALLGNCDPEDKPKPCPKAFAEQLAEAGYVKIVDEPKAETEDEPKAKAKAPTKRKAPAKKS